MFCVSDRGKERANLLQVLIVAEIMDQEDSENIFQKQAACKTKTKVGKPPTRLQKHAPAALQLDRVNVGRNRTVIPLLSPLTVSPGSSSEATAPTLLPMPEAEQFRFPECVNQDTGSDEKRVASSAQGGWQHPDDPSSLLSLFQSKFVIVNDP